jgi:hypothetical protein
MISVHERRKSPLVLSEILNAIKNLENRGEEPTFNTIMNDLSTRRILSFHRSLRKYLDLLVFAKLLTVKHGMTVQPNIREKQIYHTKDSRATLEAGEKALLIRGLNWYLPAPKSVYFKSDLEALALGAVSGNKVYASLEDSIVQSLKVLSRFPEIVVFATALLATQKIDFRYLLQRAREEGIEEEIIGILKTIDDTFASKDPDVEDILTLYKLRDNYARIRKSLLKALHGAPTAQKDSHLAEFITPNQVVEYAGKQLGIKG